MAYSDALPGTLTYLFEPEADFRKETIYFLVIDRFFSGSAANNFGQKQEMFDPERRLWGHYWGGDLQGVIDKVGYLRDLGITAVWLSPLLEQVEDMLGAFGPMHGYWIRDFKRINPRYVSPGEPTSLQANPTLQRLLNCLHENGIKVILDVVCNHSSPEINGSKGVVYDDGMPLADYYNDVNNFYYHYSGITDWQDEFQLIHHEMMGLATFNEQNPAFRRYIREAIRCWLDLGIDGLRIDTLKHMPVWFWQEFVAVVQKHRPSTFLFGEYGFGSPFDQRTVRYANDTGISILDFGLCGAIREAYSGSAPGGFQRVKQILDQDHVYKRATELVTFHENHDMPRFLSVCDSHQALESATTLLLTLRGIPCLFYGCEQYLVNNTNGGQDPYNRPMQERWQLDTELARRIRILSNLRRLNRALAYGSSQSLWLSDDIWVFSRSYHQNRVLVILNKGAANRISVEGINWPDGDYRCLLTDRTFVLRGSVLHDVYLEPFAAHVLAITAPSLQADVVVKFQINGYFTQPGDTMAIVGDVPELGEWDPMQAARLEYVNGDAWFAEVPFNVSAGSVIAFKAVVLRNGAEPVWENLVPRRFLLPGSGRLKLDLDWDQR
jgi:cyclomaltodextrin glucanotransferase